MTALPTIDYATHPLYGGMFEPDEALGRKAMEILEPLVAEMTKVESDRMRLFGYRYGSGGVSEILAKDSVHLMQVGSRQMDTIDRAAHPILSSIIERIAAEREAGNPLRFKTINHVVDRNAEGPDMDLWRATDGMLTETGVHDVVRDFFGASGARINSLAVFVNPPQQEWANHLFRDLDVGTPPTAGMHIDSNGKCYLKGILYLTDVEMDQGPFSVIPGSHLWNHASQDRILRRAFDRSPLLARMPEERQMFISLPKEMQVKAEFGGDLLPDSADAKALLDQELNAVGPRGQLNLFWPEAVHRGGNVKKGARHALQITLTPVW